MQKYKNKDADTRDRTRDLQIFSLTLSQLSYIGENAATPCYESTKLESSFLEKSKKGAWGN